LKVTARKSKNAKAKAVANRTLDSITGEIHAALKVQTLNIILVGELLVEANEQVEHGKWLPWLHQEFDLSERTAHRYMRVARLVAKSATVANLNLSPSALYVFADEADECDDEHMVAILKVAATTPERITKSRAQEIVDTYFDELSAAEEAKEQSEVADPKAIEDTGATANDDAGAAAEARKREKEADARASAWINRSAEKGAEASQHDELAPRVLRLLNELWAICWKDERWSNLQRHEFGGPSNQAAAADYTKAIKKLYSLKRELTRLAKLEDQGRAIARARAPNVAERAA
jgi:hypothetical protein